VRGAPATSRETSTGASCDSIPAGPRITADLDLCQGHNMCQAEAPGVLGWDAEAQKVVVLDEHPGPERLDDLRRAVRACPAMALTLDEAGEETQ
jgi:ferredoxin